jgi:hypothetical protein
MLDVVIADGLPPSRGSGRSVNVWSDDEDNPFADAAVHENGYRLEWRGIGVLTFAPRSTLVRLWPASGVDAETAASAVRHLIQPVILQALGYQTLHASAVQLSTGVVAFCGISGTGKSTLAFALGQAPGTLQTADDALVLGIAPATIVAHPLPFRPRLRPASLAYFAHSSSAGNRARAQTAPLLAIFVLRPSDDDSIDLTRIGATRAFAALLTHAHCFDEADRTGVASMVEAYLTLAEKVPVYELSSPRDFSRITAVQECVLQAVARHSIAGHA